MKIDQIKIHNFLTFKDVNLSFEEGVFFITGENLDDDSTISNGAGKSIFCQAFIWCLFDDILRKGLLKNDVIGESGEYCQVILTLEKDGKEIVVDRVRNHPERGHDVKVLVDGDDKSRHSASDTNDFICQQLGVNAKVFYYCAYSDDLTPPFLSLTPTQTEKVISEVLNVQRFDDYIKSIRSLRRDKEQELTNTVGQIQGVKVRKGEIVDDIKSLKKNIKNLEEDKRDGIRRCRNRINQYESDIEEYQEIVDMEQGLLEKKKKLSGYTNELDSLKLQFKHLESDKSEAVAKRTKIETKIQRLRSAVKEQENAFDNLTNNTTGKCSYCGNLLRNSDNLSEIVKEIEQKKDALMKEIVQLEVDRDAIDSKLESINSKMDKVSLLIEDNQEFAIAYQKVVNKLNLIAEARKNIQSLQEHIEGSEAEIERWKAKTDKEWRDRLESKEEKRDELDEELDLAKLKVESLKLDKEACEVLEELLNKMKTGLINSFVLKLQESIDVNLQQIANDEYGCEVTLNKEGLELLFINSEKKVYSNYHTFSTGERVKLEKAAKITLNEMLDVGILFDDEGLNGLDAKGAQDILDFIVDKGQGRTLFFTSHDPSVKDYFEQVSNVHVTKERGISRAEVR